MREGDASGAKSAGGGGMSKEADAYSSGMRGGEKPKKGEVTEVRIRPAANGFTVHVNRHEVYGRGIPMWGLEDKPTVHESVESAMSRVREHLESSGKGKVKK